MGTLPNLVSDLISNLECYCLCGRRVNNEHEYTTGIELKFHTDSHQAAISDERRLELMTNAEERIERKRAK